MKFQNRILTEKDLNILKRILKQQKRNLIFKNCLSDEFNLNQEERSDDVDHANADISNYQRLRFRTRENLYEKKLDDALKRIENKEYGFCKDCGVIIGFTRLRARPTAELCIQCKEESERSEFSSLEGRKSRSFGDLLALNNAY